MPDKPGLKDTLQHLEQSINDLLDAWYVTRVCPGQIQAPPPTLSLNLLTLAISLVIVLAARRSVAGSDTDISIMIVATIISNLIVFGTGYVTFVIAPGPTAKERSQKWGTFFVMSWLSSLLFLILFDALPFWLDHTPLTTQLIDVIFGPGVLPPIWKDVIRAAFYGILAMAVLLLKSKRMDPSFAIFSACSLLTCGLGLFVIMLLMGGFIYGHIV